MLQELSALGYSQSDSIRQGIRVFHQQQTGKGNYFIPPAGHAAPEPVAKRPVGRPPKPASTSQDDLGGPNAFGFVFDLPDDKLMGFLELSGLCAQGGVDPEGTNRFVSWAIGRKSGAKVMVISKHMTKEGALSGGDGFTQTTLALSLVQEMLEKHLKGASQELMARLRDYVRSALNPSND